MPLMNSQGNANVYKQSSSPAAASTGDVWIDTDNGQVFTYSGSAWVQQSGGALGTGLQQLRVNAGATALEFAAPALTVSAEQNSTPVTDSTEGNIQNTSAYAYHTISAGTYDYIRITGIEWKNGSAVNGTVYGGVHLVNADTPTDADKVLVAWFNQEITQTGTSAVQRNSDISSLMIDNTSAIILGIWVNSSSATSQFRRATAGGAANYDVTKTYPGAVDNVVDSTAWQSSTRKWYVKVYYKGFTEN